LLSLHVVTAVGALATDAILLSLAATGRLSRDADLIRAVYLVMDLLLSAVLLPFALTALVTGIVLGLGSHWGVVRHYWVLTKLVLTLAAATAAVLLLRPALNESAAAVLAVPLADLPATGIGPVAIRVMAGPTIGVLMMTAAVVLAVSKPWGRTRFRAR
jgi:hypothetical protein